MNKIPADIKKLVEISPVYVRYMVHIPVAEASNIINKNSKEVVYSEQMLDYQATLSHCFLPDKPTSKIFFNESY
jgi:hypothetical protein